MPFLNELGIEINSGIKKDRGEGVNGINNKYVKKTDKDKEKISKQEVYHVAKLARLKLTESEALKYQKDLNSILTYVDSLKELDTENVRPMSHGMDIKNVWREDLQVEEKKPEDLLSNAPMREGKYFKVPKILEG